MASLNRMKVKQLTYYIAKNISKIVYILKMFVLTFQQLTCNSSHLSPLTSEVVGAPQMTVEQYLSTLPCLLLPTGNLQTSFLDAILSSLLLSSSPSCSFHSPLVYGMAWQAWHCLWYGLAGMAWYLIWPGRAWHGIWYYLGRHGMIYGMVWPGGHGMVNGMI